MVRLITVVGLLVTASPALAGANPAPVPDPEVGIGLASMALVGAGVAWLRKRRQR